MEITEIITKDDPRKFKTMTVVGRHGPSLLDLEFGIVEKTINELSGGIGDRFVIVYDMETMFVNQLINLSLFDFTNAIDSVDKWKEFTEKYFPKPYCLEEEGEPVDEEEMVNGRRRVPNYW